ncbi:hypothetical protein [Endozoicomonas sp. SCSIO W0465]|uniref:hypothetical protein n=1 Tax=Endozoicomonas sp. SCSIO W0465 TaxID=2918516 RepID=UPI002075573E|nr:hypothetical protein [Endozoicomonas sp. SCSIO W0465]USE37498.1 hypothetical protein MJO57_04560 [Endozoicomonas sp. SCSIO W0465]
MKDHANRKNGSIVRRTLKKEYNGSHSSGKDSENRLSKIPMTQPPAATDPPLVIHHPPAQAAVPVSTPETYLKKEPFLFTEGCKTLVSRVICAVETTLWHVMDAFNWAGYLAVWAMAGATFMVGMMALPFILKSALTGIIIMACEAIGEAVLRYYSSDQFPTDRLPVLLDRLPLEKLPVLGDFLSFRWLRHLPFQGERCDENKLTYFGSRVVVGGVYGSFLGFFSSLITLSPYSILATGAVAAGIAFGLRCLGCAKVALDFLFLSNHEMNESRLYHKDNFVNRPVRDRLIGNTESSNYFPMPPPENINVALQLLNIQQDKEVVTQDEIYQAAEARCNEKAQQGLPKALFNREVSLIKHAQEQLYRFVTQRDLQDAKQRTLQTKLVQLAQEQERTDRALLDLPAEGELTSEQVKANYRRALNDYARYRDKDINEIDRAASRLNRSEIHPVHYS